MRSEDLKGLSCLTEWKKTYITIKTRGMDATTKVRQNFLAVKQEELPKEQINTDPTSSPGLNKQTKQISKQSGLLN